jgi:uncharacterized membrane protein
MNTLSSWRFTTPEGAETALRTLERLQHRRRVVVEDAAVVVWPTGARRPRSYQVGTAAGTAALAGAFWGLLVGVVFLLPLAADATGATDPAAGLSRVGLPDEFLRQLRDRITPGTSALFLLSRRGELDPLREAFADTHADLLTSDLDREQDAALRRAFDAEDDLVTR